MYFTSCGARKVIDPDKIFRHFIGREALFAEVNQVVFPGQGHTWLWQQVGTSHLAPLLVRHTKYGGFEYAGMCSKLTFNLGSVDILTTGYVHVFQAADDVVIAILVLTAEITTA
mgnify:CR=1 FL=1